MKKNYGSYSNVYKCFFHFELLTYNTVKNETMGKIEKFTWNKFNKVLIRIPGTSRSYRHTNMSGFRVDIPRLFLHQEIKINISCREKFFTRKFARRFLGPTPYILPLPAVLFQAI